jgi:hypothetical protein
MISNYILLMVMHTLGDIVLQGFKMDKLKRFSLAWLALHIGIYAVIAFLFTIAFLDLGLKVSLVFVAFNVVLHFGIDFLTGLAKQATWDKHRENMFFGVVILDQFSHLILLFLSYGFLLKHPF